MNSTKWVTDSDGKLEVRYEYRAFGEQLKRLSHSGEEVDDLAKYSYSGKELDDTTNLYYFNARFYDATIGRFINVDPVQDGLNWYVFCSNNPLCFVDPTGLTKQTMEAARASWEEQDVKNNPNPAASDQVMHTDEMPVNNKEFQAIQSETQRIQTLQSDQVSPARLGQPAIMDVGPSSNAILNTGDPVLSLPKPQEHSATDVSLSVGFAGVGVVQGTNNDIYQYVALGYTGVGMSTTYSDSDPQEGWTFSAQGYFGRGKIGFGGEYSVPLDGSSDGSFTPGVGSKGFSVQLKYTKKLDEY